MVALPGGRLVLHTHRSAEDVMVLEPSPLSEGEEGEKTAVAAPRRVTLRRFPVHGVFPGRPSLFVCLGYVDVFGGLEYNETSF